MLNSKVAKVAQEVLFYCCANITQSSLDQEIISILINIRWRGKIPQSYLQAIGLSCERNTGIEVMMVQRIILSELAMDHQKNSLNYISIIQHLILKSEKTVSALIC